MVFLIQETLKFSSWKNAQEPSIIRYGRWWCKLWLGGLYNKIYGALIVQDLNLVINGKKIFGVVAYNVNGIMIQQYYLGAIYIRKAMGW